MADNEELGRVAYTAYGDERRWVAVNGAPIPYWDDQAPDLRAAWITAALAVARAVDNMPEGGDGDSTSSSTSGG